MEKKKYHFVYKTTNLISGRFYIGRHTTKYPNGIYLGSGVALNDAINSYGRENFKKEIIEFCETKEELYIREAFWIKELNAVEVGYNLTDKSVGGALDCDGYNNRFDELIRCPHCNKESYNKAMMINVHFDNCLQNPNLDIERFKKKKEKTKIKRDEYLSQREEKECPWCKYKSKNQGVLRTLHFDNCKKNPNYIDKRKDILCPYCGKIGKVQYMMERYHFDNCQLSPTFNKEKADMRKLPQYVKDKLRIIYDTEEYKLKHSIGLKGIPKIKIKCEYCGLEGTKPHILRHVDTCKLNPNFTPIIKQKQEIVCPHCNEVSFCLSAMKRWHFDNCLENPSNNKEELILFRRVNSSHYGGMKNGRKKSKTNPCPICNRQIGGSYNLKKHIEKHKPTIA